MAQTRPFYGIVGFIESGKNAYKDVLLSIASGQSHSFASALKDGVAAIFGWPRYLLEGDTAESRIWREQPDEYWSRFFGRTITPRRVLQEVGTDAFRAWCPDIWIGASGRRATGDGIHIFTDTRFRNEMDWIRRQDGLVVWVYRPSASLSTYDVRDRRMVDELVSGSLPLSKQMLSFVSDVHESETSFLSNGQDLIDIVVINDGQLTDYTAIIGHVEALRARGEFDARFPLRHVTLYVSKQHQHFQWKWHDCHGYRTRYYDMINNMTEEGFDTPDAETIY